MSRVRIPLLRPIRKGALRLLFHFPVDKVKIIAYNYLTMTTYSTHYNDGLSQHMTRLSEVAMKRAKELVSDFNPKKGKYKGFSPLIAYSGMSGISMATAVAMMLRLKHPKFKFGMVYVRKDDEKSHGRPVEFVISDDVAQYMLVFADDFISSGTTGNFVYRKCCEELPGYVNVFDALHEEGCNSYGAAVLHYGDPFFQLSDQVVTAFKIRNRLA